MTAIRLGVFDHDSPEWHRARATRIGGSDVPSIMGEGFLSRGELLAQKRGLTADRKASPAMHRGNDAEPTIAAWLARNAKIEYDHARLGTYVDAEHDWMAYNPDQFTLCGKLVEFKCPEVRRKSDGWGRGGTDQVPMGYRMQVTWGMGIFGDTKETLFGVMATKYVKDREGNHSSAFDFAKYKVKFDAGLFAELKAEAELFHREMSAPAIAGFGVSALGIDLRSASVTVNDLGEDQP